MAYYTPYVDATGLHIPTYTDIRDALIADAKSIFGSDIYLEIDSQDYQYISIVANKIYDSFLTAQLVYNNRSPVTSIGTSLDSIVKINGIVRTQNETDSALRARQTISTARPSKTVLEGLKGGITEISGVTRFMVYENDTGNVSSEGLPAHSVTSVVEGGLDADVANEIYLRKGPGNYTNGTTSVNVTDLYGNITPIRFYRPTYVNIIATINVKSLPGYTSAITDAIKSNVVAYLNGLSIGTDLAISSLWGAALSAMPDLKNPLFSITSLQAAKQGNVLGTTDIVIAFNEVTQSVLANITVNVT